MIISTEQAQEKVFRSARTDGGYPRLVMYPFGIVALAHNEEEWERMEKKSRDAHIFAAVALGITMVVVTIVIVAVAVGAK